MSDLFGGDSPAPAPVQQQNWTDLAPWARPHAEKILNMGEALTDLSQNPYQAYKGNRIAGFSDMQKGAMANVASPEAWGKSVQGYMSPYMQNVVEQQQRNAREQAGAQMGGLNARAAQMGAFGGSGIALQRAAQNRDLAKQLEGIQATGLQTAFQQGTQQANLANQQQMQYGTMQQQQEQKGLDTAYQDFLNQKNYPYQQLSYYSNLVRGTPMGMNSTSQVYQPPPTSAQNLAALGTAAYGVSKFMADGGMAYAAGGEIEGYAGDSGSYVGGVDSRENVEEIVHSMRGDLEALQRAYQAAQARGDKDQIEAIEKEMAITASLRNGIAGGVTNEMATRMAGGGILAFAGDEEDNDPVSGQLVTGVPNQAALREWMDAQKAIKEFTPREAMTLADRDKLDKANYERYSKFAGEDPYAPMAARIKGSFADLDRQREEGKGALALSLIPTILKPGGQGRAFGETFGQLGAGLGALAQAQAKEKRALEDREFNLADAQRKERMGLTKDAITATTEAQKDQIAADKAKLDALKARAKAATDAGRAFRTTGGAGGAGKGPKLAEQLAAAEIAHEKNPTDETLKTVNALRRAMLQTKTTDIGSQKADMARMQILSNENAKVQTAMNKFEYNPAYLEAQAKGPAEAKAVWEAELAKQRSLFPTKVTPLPVDSDVNRNSGNNTPPPPPGFTPN